MKKNDDEYTRARPWLVRAAVLSGVSGLIHMVLTPVYFAHWLGYGAFFFLASVGQFSYAAVLAVNPPNRYILWTGIAGNALIILIWAITRTVGIPFFGPMAGQVEPVGVLDVISKLVETAVIVHLAVLLNQHPRLREEPLVD
ncbi:MAG: hypothetical protein ACK2UC_09870 [Anaerolineae bacterium]